MELFLASETSIFQIFCWHIIRVFATQEESLHSVRIPSFRILFQVNKNDERYVKKKFRSPSRSQQSETQLREQCSVKSMRLVWNMIERRLTSIWHGQYETICYFRCFSPCSKILEANQWLFTLCAMHCASIAFHSTNQLRTAKNFSTSIEKQNFAFPNLGCNFYPLSVSIFTTYLLHILWTFNESSYIYFYVLLIENSSLKWFTQWVYGILISNRISDQSCFIFWLPWKTNFCYLFSLQ